MRRLLLTLSLLAPSLVHAGSAKLLKLEAESGTISPELEAALKKSLLPFLPGCVPYDSLVVQDTLKQTLRIEVHADGTLQPGERKRGTYWLDETCVLISLLNVSVPKPSEQMIINADVEVKTTAAERGAVKARALSELAHFCQQVAKTPKDDRQLAAARLVADPRLTGPARLAFKSVADTNPDEHLQVLQGAAAELGGKFDCPALAPPRQKK